MARADKNGNPLFSNRTLAILATVLWVAAITMAGFYLAGLGRDSDIPVAALKNPTEAAQASGPATSVGVNDTPTGSGAAPPTASVVSTSTTSIVTSTSSTSTSTPTSTMTSTTLAPPALTVAAGGDVLGDRGVGTFIDENGGPAVLSSVKPFLESADVAFVNLEGPVSNKGSRNPVKQYTFRGRPLLIDGLNSAGIDVVSLANNHTLDYGPAALLDTVTRLDAAGVAHAGAGKNAAAAQSPALLRTPAGSVAVLAFTEIVPGGFAATTKQAGVNPITPAESKRLKTAVTAARKAADYVIVSFHWGTEYTGQASQDQRALAHIAVDAGADLILGHHPHVIQGLELYHDRLIAYSLGDFVFDHYSRLTGESFVLRVVLKPAGPPSVEVVPVYLRDSTGIPSPVTGEEADTILTRLTKLSASLGMELSRAGDRVIYGSGVTSSP